MNLKHIAFAMLSTSVLLLQGCFTGVESTPKITSKDLRKQNIVETAEMHYLDSVAPQRLSAWKEGKLFIVTNPKFSYFINNTDGLTLRAGDTIVYERHAPAMSVTGRDATEFYFKSKDQKPFSYRVNATEKELEERNIVEIPFTIELSIIDSLRNKLDGKSLYVLTPIWYDLEGNAINGKKYLEVDILDVLPGNDVYPSQVVFRDKEGHHGSVMMSTGGVGGTSRTFHTLFAFTDPHLRFPAITPENWELIKNSRVTSGMTRDECRLALGAPNEVDRRPSSMGLVEVWGYNSGKYLMFQDGILTSYRY